jgi:hypothetical protein
VPPRPLSATRRVVLGAALLGTAGCSRDPAGSSVPTDRAGAASTSSPEPSVPPEEAIDEALVTEVLGALAVAHRTATTNARLHPGLAARLRPLQRLHQAHARELGDLPRSTGRVADPGESDAAALDRVVRAETALQRVLVAAAVAAESGPLAQTMAAMAAGTAQHRVALEAAA